MSDLSALSGGVSSGGSAQSSSSNAYGYSNSETDGSAAREWSAQQAAIARDWQEKMMQKQMEYNSAEAEKARTWEQHNINVANEMANTVYTRAAKNMQEAGINPILAYSAGLGGVGQGATSGSSAATTSLPSGFMAQSFADQHSASEQWSKSQGSGSSWQQSENGLATGLQLMGQAISEAIGNLNTGHTLNYYMNDLKGSAKSTWEDIKLMLIEHLPGTVTKSLGLTSTQNEGPSNKGNNTSFSHKTTVKGSGTVGSSHSTGRTKF